MKKKRYFIIFYVVEQTDKRTATGYISYQPNGYINKNEVVEFISNFKDNTDNITLTNIIELSKSDWEDFRR